MKESDYVLFWWQRGEFAEQREEWQVGASYDQAGSDLLYDTGSITAMQAAPLGEPESDFDVRCVFDSRIVNGYDFNYSAQINIGNAASGSGGWSAQFNVPNGYRIIPRKWSVQFDKVFGGAAFKSTASIQQSGALLPNNGPIIIGMGTDNPIETFFVCEENTTFGIAGVNNNTTQASTGTVNVYGNMIPVTETALPLSVANQRQLGTGQAGVNS